MVVVKIMQKNNSLLSLMVLVKRNVKMFLKDKMLVFFSLLAPLIVLMLYVLFLGNIQAEAVNEVIKDYAQNVDPKLIMAFINNWMISGVMGVACVTVAFNACTIMVRDREKGTINDVLASPVKRWVIYLSYIISCFVISLVICIAVFLVSTVYLACTGGAMMSFVDALAILGIIILSILSASVISVFIANFIKSEGAFGSVSGIMSAAVGFLTGAYMPLAMFPEAIQHFVCFIPGTYSAGLFRNYFLQGPMNRLLNVLPEELVNQLMQNYSVQMKFFGTTISAGWMVLALFISIFIFGIILAVFFSKKKTNVFLLTKRKIKNK